MKRLLTIILALLIISTVAVAEEVSPAAYFTDLGFTVLGESQIKAFGIDVNDLPTGFNYCFLIDTSTDQSSLAMVYYDGSAFSMLMDFGTLIGSPTMTFSETLSAFLDYLGNTDMFDACVFRDGTAYILYAKDPDTLDKIMTIATSEPDPICDSFEDFIAAINTYVYGPSEVQEDAPVFSVNNIDWQSLTDEELMTISEAANNEMLRRAGVDSEPAAEDHGAESVASDPSDGVVFGKDVVLLDDDGYLVTFTGNYDFDAYGDSAFLNLETIVTNNSTKTLAVSCDEEYANGWRITIFGPGGVNPGKKAKGEFSISLSNTDIRSFEELNDIEFDMSLYDTDSYDTVKKLGLCKLIFKH